MKLLLMFALLFIVFDSISAQARSIRRDPDYPGKCAVKPGIIMSLGETIRDPDSPCGVAFCGPNNVVTFTSCGTQRAPPRCIWGDYLNANLDFPSCCSRKLICRY